jgi:hypothetical protein
VFEGGNQRLQSAPFGIGEVNVVRSACWFGSSCNRKPRCGIIACGYREMPVAAEPRVQEGGIEGSRRKRAPARSDEKRG